jgi:transcription termination factor Rho
MAPDQATVLELRKDYSARKCAEVLLAAVADVLATIGVTVEYEIASIDDDIIVDRTRLAASMCKVATASGVVLAGGSVNPVDALALKDPMRLIREREENNV